jgi:putative ABC transport system ATP-binding protein
MLTLDNIYVNYGDRVVLSNFTLAADAGEITCLLGHNGAGKSTVFGVVAGIVVPQSGNVELSGESIAHLCEAERALMIGRLMQDVSVGSVGSMTMAENLCLATLKGRRATLATPKRELIADVVEQILVPLKLGLEKLLDVPMHKLSGGQRQIVAFVMAILVKPKLLLLDEPTAALDPESAQCLLRFVRAYVECHNIPALLITHDEAVAAFAVKRITLRGLYR